MDQHIPRAYCSEIDFIGAILTYIFIGKPLHCFMILYHGGYNQGKIMGYKLEQLFCVKLSLASRVRVQDEATDPGSMKFTALGHQAMGNFVDC